MLQVYILLWWFWTRFSINSWCFIPLKTDATKITLAPSNADINQGDNVTLQCHASHDPTMDLTFTWSLNGVLLDLEQPNGHYHRIEGVTALFITVLTMCYHDHENQIRIDYKNNMFFINLHLIVLVWWQCSQQICCHFHTIDVILTFVVNLSETMLQWAWDLLWVEQD